MVRLLPLVLRKGNDMNVIKAPKFNICECEVCKTVFEPDYYDELHYMFTDFKVASVYARCPTCSSLVEATTKGE